MAAAVAVAALAVWLVAPMWQATPAALAAVVRVSGPVQVGDSRPWRGLVTARAGESVAAGDEIRSGPGGRVALQLGNLSLRLDQNSTVAMVAADRVELRRGALYVDSGRTDAGGAALLVDTPQGTVRHLGTQYEARLLDDGLRLRVREGMVRVDVDGATADGRAGEQLVVGQGVVRRAAVDRAGQDWAWVGEIAPGFELEGRSLAEFLHWIGRETGREISFASPASRAEADRIRLRGSTAGLAPERALAAVMSTTQLAFREQGGRLLIDFQTGETR
jgi:ferric-dicitrate binding protein FerR (iron transport regulator)